MKTKRKPTTKRPSKCFKLNEMADSALSRIARTWGWTNTAAVERALIFAAAHKDFGPRATEARP